MNRRIYYLPFLFLIILSLGSCRVSKDSVNPTAGLAIPAGFGQSGINDSVSISDTPWRIYFGDTTLIGLVDTALDRNLDLKMSLQQVEAARGDLIYRRGLLLPAVGVYGSAGQSRMAKYSAAWAGNEGGEYPTGEQLAQQTRDYNLGFEGSWELDIWGKLNNYRKAALARFMESSEGKKWFATGLVANVANTYYDLLSLNNELNIINETIELQKNALTVVEAQKEAGAANELAVKQFQAQLLSSQGLEKQVNQQITETSNNLNLLLGRFPENIQINPDKFNDSIPFNVHAGIPASLLQNRPDVKQAEYELIATKADLKAARRAFLPSFNITGAAGFNAFNLSYLLLSPQSIAYNVLGNLAAPLINRSAIRADFKRATANQLQALYNYQKTILEAYVEVYNEIADIRNLEQEYSLKKQQVDILAQSTETSSELFTTGKATYLEVLMAEKDALQARLELTDLKRQEYQAYVNIYRALGGGWK